MNVKQTEWNHSASQRHLQTPIKQSQHLLFWQKTLALKSAVKTNTEMLQKSTIIELASFTGINTSQ